MDKNTCLKFKVSGIDFFKSGQLNNAIEALKKYTEYVSNDEEVLTLLADAYYKKGFDVSAFEYYSQSLAINPIHTSNLLKFSALQLEGPNYTRALKFNHDRLKPSRYIEIGVCKGVSFGLTSPETTSIGIDPEPQLDLDALPKKHVIVSDTSDNYFARDDVLEEFHDQTFDMAFLDGMHLFEYALRDFMNLEKYSNLNSVVFVHDVYPMNKETATRERNSDFWSGDVWKLILCLQEYRPDLKLEVLPCPPTGLGVITNLDKHSSILHDKYDEILDKYADLPFSVIEKDRAQKLLLVDTESVWLHQ